MKKVISILVVLALLTTVAFAASTPKVQSVSQANEVAVKMVAENYIRKYTEKTLLIQDWNLREGTVFVPSGKYTGNTQVETRSGVKTIDQLCERIRFWNDKADYFATAARAYNTYVEDVTFNYTVTDFELDGDWAWVALEEWVEYFYVGEDIPSGAITRYEVELLKFGNNWYVADLTSDFWFDAYYNETTFTTDDLVEFAQSLEQELTAINARIESHSEPVVGTMQLFEEQLREELGEQSRGANTIYLDYDADTAMAYALEYTKPNAAGGTNNAYYNPRFYWWSGNDCQNFASQCIWAGFGGTDTAAAINGKASPMDTLGTNQWWGTSSGSSQSWNSTTKFREYLDAEADVALEDDWYGLCVGRDDIAANVADFSSVVGADYTLLEGAVIHSVGNGGAYGHAIVVSGIDETEYAQNYGLIKRSTVRVTAHTNDRYNLKLSSLYPTEALKLFIPFFAIG